MAHSNSLERTLLRRTWTPEARSEENELLRIMMEPGLLSSQPLDSA